MAAGSIRRESIHRQVTDVLTPQPAPPHAAPPSARAPRPGRSRVVALLRLWPFPAMALLAVAAWGWQRQSAGGATGPTLFGTISPAAAAQAPTTGRFRVGIYNIQGAIGKQEVGAVDRIAKIIADTDVCGLAEVRANALHADNRNQAQQVAEALGRAWLFAPAERRFFLDGVGNGVACRLAGGPWTRFPLPHEGDAGGHRNVVLLRATVAGRAVNVLVTHVDRGPARVAQLRAVAHLFASVEAPAVLLGDLNAEPADPALAPLLAIPGVADPIGTRLGGNQDKRVDWILSRGLTVVDAGRTDDPAASDHSFFWADLELAPGAVKP